MASRSVSLSHDRSPPMFQARSLNRGEIATDLAIPLIVERGWQGLTITALAESGNMRKQSVAQWFGSLDKFRERIAWRYSWRWSILISSRTDRLYGERADGEGADGEGADASTLTRALLPRDDDGIAFTRVWLSMVEAARSDDLVAAAVRDGEQRERRLIEGHLPDADSATHALVSAVVSGLRMQLCATEPITLEEAERVADELRR